MPSHAPIIAVGRLWQETNTFAETRTTLADFARGTWRFGADMLPEIQSQQDELGGFADGLLARGAQIVPLAAATTWCGGAATQEVAETFTASVVRELRAAAHFDGVLFSLHGAMAGEKVLDIEGHVLSAIRATVGGDVPIAVTLDHHANVTRAMIEAADVLTAYRHCPHRDMRETGRRGARMLLDLLDGASSRPTIAHQKIPLVTPCEQFRTAEGPMHEWFALARRLEQTRGVIDVSLFPVQPWLDVPELGWSCTVTTDADQDLAEDLCAQLAQHAWNHRGEFYVEKFAPDDAVRRAASAREGPMVIADGADATNGGSPGDSTCLLKEMLAQRITCPAFLTMVDPEAVAAAYQAGAGTTITLDLGAKRSRRFHTPVRVTATVVRFADGRFDIGGHLSARVNMGRCALLKIGDAIHVVVSEFAGPGHDPAVYRHLGLEPSSAQIVVVKATVGHMDAYAGIMKQSLPCECPGPSPSYLDRLDYRNIPRPMFPFDRQMDWLPKRARTAQHA
jgi:microcystin degradation protein MlrC